MQTSANFRRNWKTFKLQVSQKTISSPNQWRQRHWKDSEELTVFSLKQDNTIATLLFIANVRLPKTSWKADPQPLASSLKTLVPKVAWQGMEQPTTARSYCWEQ